MLCWWIPNERKKTKSKETKCNETVIKLIIKNDQTEKVMSKKQN